MTHTHAHGLIFTHEPLQKFDFIQQHGSGVMIDRLAGNSKLSEAPAWQSFRTPSTSLPLLSDLFVAIFSFIFALTVWNFRYSAEDALLNSFFNVGTYLLVFTASFALLWRRSHPLQVHAVVLGISVLLNNTPSGNGIITLVFSLYALGRFAADDRTSLAGMLAVLLFVGINSSVFVTPSISGIVTTGLVVAVWYVGRRLRFRGEYLRLLEAHAIHLERERETESQRAVLAERARIAREMHDIVAHQLSLMTVQAGAAKTVSRSDPDAAFDAMETVEKLGRQAVSEMRQLLGVLRPANMDADSLGPQPGISDLNKLVADVTDAGVNVDLQITGKSTGLQALLELNIYRIVQEALTNVIKHAGKGAEAVVHLDVLKDTISIRIKDNGKNNIINKSGFGIIGMRERVELLGGSLTATHHAEGGFEVCALVPLELKAV